MAAHPLAGRFVRRLAVALSARSLDGGDRRGEQDDRCNQSIGDLDKHGTSPRVWVRGWKRDVPPRAMQMVGERLRISAQMPNGLLGRGEQSEASTGRFGRPSAPRGIGTELRRLDGIAPIGILPVFMDLPAK